MQRHAVVVGIDSYKASAALPRLSSAASDAAMVADALRSQSGFHAELLTGKEATREALLKALSLGEQADTFVLYFAGHGQSLSGQYAVYPSDADECGQNVISLEELCSRRQDTLQRGHTLLVIDACRSTVPHGEPEAGLQRDAASFQQLESRYPNTRILASSVQRPWGESQHATRHSLLSSVLPMALWEELWPEKLGQSLAGSLAPLILRVEPQLSLPWESMVYFHEIGHFTISGLLAAALTSHGELVEVTIDSDFPAYSWAECRFLLDRIQGIVGDAEEVRYLGRRPGSVIVRLQLSKRAAQRLLKAVAAGELDALGVRHARTIASATAEALVEEKRREKRYDVFMCHNSDDKPAVREIGKRLKSYGILPWLDEWDLQPGLPWQAGIEEHLQSIGSAAVFVGPNGIGPWQDMEIAACLRQFVKRQCPIIPVVLPECKDTPELPLFLEGMTWVDFNACNQDSLDRLVWGITGMKP